tara:strand:+ start:10587 stop:11036 length:450 start_codon:yes stop_codon:yes gene_type:complete
MIKVLFALLSAFFLWLVFVKVFAKDEESSIDDLSSKFLSDFTLIFQNILDLFDSLFKSFIQVYDLLGSSLKNLVGIFKSLTSAFIKFLNLFKIIGITFLSFFSLCQGLYKETRNINLTNSFESIVANTQSAKNNLINLFNNKDKDEKNI